MTKDTHVTAPICFVEADGIRYAYRRFGSESGTPLVFLQHFRGGLDNWDPLVTDGLAQGRPVILFNNAGVASSSGETPNTAARSVQRLTLLNLRHVCIHDALAALALPQSDPGLMRVVGALHGELVGCSHKRQLSQLGAPRTALD